ncbi:MAG: methyltransferase domain-containing protein [Deltaproteobacteria bacterium]|nr:methyltransferase domain-containing protein [Deltaproteobacteria bacterium]
MYQGSSKEFLFHGWRKIKERAVGGITSLNLSLTSHGWLPILFIFQSLKNPLKIAAILPSSATLARNMVKILRKNPVETVVELGAGTGSITAEILQNLPQTGLVYCFEINGEFCTALADRFKADKRLKILKDSAVEFASHLQAKQADIVFSALPFTGIPAKERDKMIEAIKHGLKPGGFYVQIVYSMLPYLKLKKEFSNVQVAFVLWNIPPAFIFICRNV